MPGETSLDLLETLYVSAILEDRRGTLWIGSAESGLFRLSLDGKLRRFTTEGKLAGDNIASLAEDHGGQIWVGMRSGVTGGLLDAGSDEPPVNRCYSTKDGLPTHWITDMPETGDGKFWLATVSGLCLW
jgi:ligand-binding sensor domain-containing protein